MAPIEPMPRYSLKRSPWCRTTSPGDSSTPASSEPSMTTSAPAASALGMSPESWMPPSATSVMPWRSGGDRAVVDGGDLRHPDAGDHPGRADRSRAHPALHAVGAGGGHGVDRFGGDDVAADHLDVEAALDLLDDVEHALVVAMAGVDDEQVDADADEGLGPLEGVGSDADRGADPEPAPVVLGGVGELRALLDVLDGDEAPERPGVVDDRELLDAVLPEDVLGLLEGGADRGGHQRRRLHHPLDHLVVVLDEAEVAVGEDPDQHTAAVDDRARRRSCSGP